MLVSEIWGYDTVNAESAEKENRTPVYWQLTSQRHRMIAAN